MHRSTSIQLLLNINASPEPFIHLFNSYVRYLFGVRKYRFFPEWKLSISITSVCSCIRTQEAEKESEKERAVVVF